MVQLIQIAILFATSLLFFVALGNTLRDWRERRFREQHGLPSPVPEIPQPGEVWVTRPSTNPFKRYVAGSVVILALERGYVRFQFVSRVGFLVIRRGRLSFPETLFRCRYRRQAINVPVWIEALAEE